MRRKVEIKNLEDLEQELNYLESADQIQTLGELSFYQIINLIKDTIYSSMHGYPRLAPWIIRKTIGRLLLARILVEGKMNPLSYEPLVQKDNSEGDIHNALSNLREVILEFRNWNKTFSVHPIFDLMDKQTWEKIHCMYASLQLSFVHPIWYTKEKVEEKLKENKPQSKKKNKKSKSKKKILKKKSKKKSPKSKNKM